MSASLFKKELTFMIEISGSGKSTKARNDVNALNKKAGLTVDPNFSDDTFTQSEDGIPATPETRAFVCSADNYPDLYNAEGQINFQLLPTAHEWCLQSVRMCMEGGHQVYLDNTNIRPDLWGPYLELAKEFGYSVRILCPTNKLLFYEVRGKDRQDLQLAHVIGVRSRGSKIIPTPKIQEMERLFTHTLSWILPSKSKCGTDPDKWLQAIQTWALPVVRRR